MNILALTMQKTNDNRNGYKHNVKAMLRGFLFECGCLALFRVLGSCSEFILKLSLWTEGAFKSHCCNVLNLHSTGIF